MPRTHLLGVAALLMTSSTMAPAMAASLPSSGSSPATGSELAIRQADLSPTWEQNFLKQIPPAPLAQNQLASAAIPGLMATAPTLAVSRVINGQASWYGPGFYGNRTANGEVLRPGTLTAAHRSLPFGTLVRVTNVWNGRSAVVRINDRGPFHGGRIIDLAHGAAQELGVTASGVAEVKLEVLR
jgi:rare lipoprotein A